MLTEALFRIIRTWKSSLSFLKYKMEYNTAVKINELDLHLFTWQMYHVGKVSKINNE